MGLGLLGSGKDTDKELLARLYEEVCPPLTGCFPHVDILYMILYICL